MPIFGLVWVASWFGSFSSLTEKVFEAPRYLSHVFFSQQSLTPDDSSSESASAPVASSLAKRLNAKFSLISDRASQSPSSTTVWLGAIETLLLNPVSQPMSYSLAFSQSVHGHSISFNETTASQPHGNPLNYLLGVVQNFFWAVPPGIAAPNFANPAPSVVVIQSSSDNPTSQIDLRTGYWRCAAWQEPTPSQSGSGSFQIWVKGCLVAEVTERSTADGLAESFTRLLENPDLDVSQLTPAYEQDLPIGKLGRSGGFQIRSRSGGSVRSAC